VLLWVLIWETAFRLSGKEEFLFPRPSTVMASVLEGFTSGGIRLDERGKLLLPPMVDALTVSLGRLLQGYGLALVLGITLGLLLAYTRFFRWLFGPLVLGVQSLPSICWVPVAILVFGLEPSAILFVVLMGSLGSISIATADGLRQIPVTYQRVAGTFGASFYQRLLWVSIPAALPTFTSGLKQGWSFAWRSLLAGEMICHGGGIGMGLGGLLDQSRNLTDYARVAALMIVLVCVSVLVDRFVFQRMEQRVQRRWGLGRK
jgi:NitT/TauT family transport system permease protein